MNKACETRISIITSQSIWAWVNVARETRIITFINMAGHGWTRPIKLGLQHRQYVDVIKGIKTFEAW